MRYLMLATVGTLLFLGAYWLLMRREKRFGMVRAYLLGTLLLSFALPLVQLPLLPPQYQADNFSSLRLVEMRTENGLTAMRFEGDKNETARIGLRRDGQGPAIITVDRDKAVPAASRWERIAHWLMLVYVVGCGAMAAMFGVRLLKLRSRLRGLPYRLESGLRISELDDETPAFSFGRHIVVGTRGFSPVEVRQLIAHEAVHARRWHTADLLLCEVAKVALWFNPAVWLYQRELKRVHEFEVDNLMLASDSGADYAELLYHQVSGHPFSPIGNTFDYGLVQSRMNMIIRKPSRRGWLKPLVVLPLMAVMLVAGCKPDGALEGYYAVDGITLMSDNPVEQALECKEFLGLENRLFRFHSDGRLTVYDKEHGTEDLNGTYKIDDDGLHLYDSTGNPWLSMGIETVSCGADSIVVRFVDPDRIGGLGKMLAALPKYRYRVDTVQVSTSIRTKEGEILELNPVESVDTVYPGIVVPCPIDNQNNWNRGNRLLTSATGGEVGVYYVRYATEQGDTVSETGTVWEFHDKVIAPDARQRYDTTSGLNPLMPDDRFILQLTLKPSAPNSGTEK